MPNVLVPNAGVEVCPKAGVGVLGLPNAGFAPKGFGVVEAAPNGLEVVAAPNAVLGAPNGLAAAGACCCGWPNMPPAAGCGLAGLGPPGKEKPHNVRPAVLA